MDTLRQDLRFALRSLRRNPGFTAIVVIVLALGIGANTAMFTVVNSVLLQPLPYRDPGRLVMLWEQRLDSDNRRNVVNPANFLFWRDEARSFSSIGAFVDRRTILGTDASSESVRMRIASATIGPMLGVRPAAGRLFTAAEDSAGAPRTAMLSYGLWQRRYGGRPEVVDSTVQIGGLPYTVVGVMPQDFQFFDPVDVWVTPRLTPDLRDFSGRSLRVVGRLKAGVTPEAAEREMAALARRQAEIRPDVERNWTAHAVPMQADLVGDVRGPLLLLTGAVAFLLLIACANIANLLLARAASRSREMAIRSSLGASPSRVLRQLLTESLLLGVLGAAAGLVVATWGTHALVSLIPSDLPVPRIGAAGLSGGVMLFTALLALITAAVFGVAPALLASRGDVHEGLKESGRSNTAGRQSGRLRSALVIAELSLAVILLAGAGLMLRSFERLRAVNPGFEPAHALAAKIALPYSRYEKPEQSLAFYNQLEQRVAALPGVTAVGAISFLPLSGERSASSFHAADRPAPPRGEEPSGDMRAVTPGYFRAMGIPLITGRLLTDADNASGTPSVAVVSQTLARTFWPNESPIGKRLLYDWGGMQDVEIVGVMGDVHHTGLADDPKMEIYRPLGQFPYTTMTLVVRSAGDPMALSKPLRSAVREVDRDQPVAEIRSLEEYVSAALGRTELHTALFATFAGLGLLLAIIGTYGLISYGVAQRTHEIGVRMALGARPSDVIGMVVWQGLRLALAGVVIGVVGALALTRLMQGLLFGVSPTDPATFAAIVVLLGLVALLASWLPARRATRIDPLIALRQE